MSISHTQTETVRELGAFERTIDLYMHRNPVQFSLVAEIDRTVCERTLARALKKVQAQHPLLRVSVDRRAPPGPVPLGRGPDQDRDSHRGNALAGGRRW
ncbi:hypothetical protein [Streptomyces sp. NPDC057363]|uniref:hypothetical protein n=1 Tax=Streptomyces sp. NPDC057363 TaxID=3346107 RepID=UPI00362C1A77